MKSAIPTLLQLHSLLLAQEVSLGTASGNAVQYLRDRLGEERSGSGPAINTHADRADLMKEDQVYWDRLLQDTASMCFRGGPRPEDGAITIEGRLEPPSKNPVAAARPSGSLTPITPEGRLEPPSKSPVAAARPSGSLTPITPEGRLEPPSKSPVAAARPSGSLTPITPEG
jgi:hypothetical protein